MVIDNADCLDDDDKESEAVGVAFCDAFFGGGTWKQTSYNNNMRKQYAGLGYTYDASKDMFIEPKPFASWTLDGSGDWQPPIAFPSDSGLIINDGSMKGKDYRWDEDAYQADNSTGWVEIE
jgi:hypothetical protein